MIQYPQPNPLFCCSPAFWDKNGYLRPYCLVLDLKLLTDNFHPTRKLSSQRPSVPIGGIFVPYLTGLFGECFMVGQSIFLFTTVWVSRILLYSLDIPWVLRNLSLGFLSSPNSYTFSTPNWIPTSESHKHSFTPPGVAKFRQHCSLSYCLVIGSEICLQDSLTVVRQVQCAGVIWLS